MPCSVLVVAALCALAASAQQEDDIQVFNKNLIKYDFDALPLENDIEDTATTAPMDLEDSIEPKQTIEDEPVILEVKYEPVILEATKLNGHDEQYEEMYQTQSPQSLKSLNAILMLDLAMMKMQQDAIFQKQLMFEKEFDQRLEDLATAIRNDVTRQLNELESKFTDKLNALRTTTEDQKSSETSTDDAIIFSYGRYPWETGTVDSREAESPSSTSESSVRAASDYDETSDESIIATKVEATTADSVEASSKESAEDTWDAVRVSASGPGSELGAWRAPFCRDEALDAATPARGWGPGDVPDEDQYDARLHALSGCRLRRVPPYDRQSFHWYSARSGESSDSSEEGAGWAWSRRVLSQAAPEQRLALRTVGAGRADIKLYWNGEKKYYFAFSNSSNTLEFIRLSPWRLLWSAQLPSAPGEHYLPLQFILDQDSLRWRAGCGGEGSEPLEASIRTAPGDAVTLEIETSAFPAKMLYDCPQDQH